MSDYYVVLGVEKNIEATRIKKAYRKLALQWHPHKNPSIDKRVEKEFKEISEIYEAHANGGTIPLDSGYKMVQEYWTGLINTTFLKIIPFLSTTMFIHVGLC